MAQKYKITKWFLKEHGFKSYKDFAIALGKWAQAKNWKNEAAMHQQSFDRLLSLFIKENF
jgi:hypothetical protein